MHSVTPLCITLCGLALSHTAAAEGWRESGRRRGAGRKRCRGGLDWGEDDGSMTGKCECASLGMKQQLRSVLTLSVLVQLNLKTNMFEAEEFLQIKKTVPPTVEGKSGKFSLTISRLDIILEPKYVVDIKMINGTKRAQHLIKTQVIIVTSVFFSVTSKAKGMLMQPYAGNINVVKPQACIFQFLFTYLPLDNHGQCLLLIHSSGRQEGIGQSNTKVLLPDWCT